MRDRTVCPESAPRVCPNCFECGRSGPRARALCWSALQLTGPGAYSTYAAQCASAPHLWPRRCCCKDERRGLRFGAPAASSSSSAASRCTGAGEDKRPTRSASHVPRRPETKMLETRCPALGNRTKMPALLTYAAQHSLLGGWPLCACCWATVGRSLLSTSKLCGLVRRSTRSTPPSHGLRVEGRTAHAHNPALNPRWACFGPTRGRPRLACEWLAPRPRWA